MAEVHVFGRVTNDLQLKMSHRQVPYVSFGLVEWIGRRDTGHRQYFEVWAWGTAALSLADAEIHKDSRIWVQGFLELVDCTRNGGSEKDKRLKLRSVRGGFVCHPVRLSFSRLSLSLPPFLVQSTSSKKPWTQMRESLWISASASANAAVPHAQTSKYCL